jgi:hypothetical protein
MHDNIEELALKIIVEAGDVLETKEIQETLENSIKNVTRTKLFARLNDLRGEGLIKGKFVGPGKGVWIWWTQNLISGKINTVGVKK